MKSIETDVFKSVFSIRDKAFRIEGRRGGYSKKEEHCGFAVAISPRHLLTAFHCVSKYSNPYLFFQPEQNIRIEEGFKVVKGDEETDLAIVELPQKLSFYSTVSEIQNRLYFLDKLVLLNHFNGEAQQQPVSRCLLTIQDRDCVPDYNLVSYKMPVRAIGGYSGSPLFTQEGKIISVAVSVNRKRQDRVEAFSDFRKALGLGSLDIPFEAVNPSTVTKFVDEYRL